jgi:hypothetical protein
MTSAMTFLERYHKDGNEFLNHIVRVTGHETRVSFVNVQTKEQSKHWIHTYSPNKSNVFKQVLSARKLMAIIFWRQEGNTDGGNYATWDHNNVRSVLRNSKQIHRAIQNKRRGMLTSGEMLLHDNALPHTAARTRALLEHFNWELFGRHPYSPDLAPSDFHLFACLKKWFGSQRFNNNEDIIEYVKTCLSSQAAGVFGAGIQKLISRCRCLNSGMTTLRSSLSVYVFFVYNILSCCLFC